jgi:hypothetical protein
MLLEKAIAKLLGGYHNLLELEFDRIFKILSGCPIISSKTNNVKQSERIL